MSKLIPVNHQSVVSRIYSIIRDGQKISVVLDKDLAEYYLIESKNLNKAANRNKSRFEGKSFKLTKKEYLTILEQRSKNPELIGKEQFDFKGGYLPTVYSEEGALAISSVLKSPVADEVFGVLLKSFFSFRQIVSQRPDLLVHQDVYDLKNRMISVEKKLENVTGIPILIQNMNNHGQIQFGSNNSMAVTISGYNDIIRLMVELLDHPQIQSSENFKKEIKEAIILATKENKKELLDKIEKISNITNTITELAVKVGPILLPIMTWLMK